MTAISNINLPGGPLASSGLGRAEKPSIDAVLREMYRFDTPFLSNHSETGAKALREDWVGENLGSVAAATALEHGFVFSAAAATAPTRYSNYVQLVAEQFGVSDTSQAINNAGGVVGSHSSMAREVLRRGRLLRRKINKLLHTPQAYDSTVSLTKTATLPAYVVAGFKSSAGTPGAAPTGDGSDIPGAGTSPVAWSSVADLNSALQAVVVYGDTPTALYVSPKNKAKFSQLPDASIADNRVNMTAGTTQPFAHIGTADIWLSDYGRMEVVMDIDAPDTHIKVINHDAVDLAFLPGMKYDMPKIGRTGSGEQAFIQACFTVRVTNPYAHIYNNGLS